MTEFEYLIDKMPESQQQQVLDHTDALAVPAGTELTDLLDVDRAMCVVLEGEVEVSWDGHVGVRQSVGGVIGPAELFVERWRDTTVRAVTDTRLWAVTPRGYSVLRKHAPSLARALEREALVALASQSRQLAGEIARQPHPDAMVEPTNPAPEVPGEPMLVSRSRIVQQIRDAIAPEVAPDRELEALADQVVARRYAAGQVIVAAGSEGGGMYLLATGEVDVVVPLDQGGGAPVATALPGNLFAVTSAVDRDVRAFEVVCTQNAVALEIKHPQIQGLFDGSTALGTGLRLASIRALARMLAQANGTWVLAALMAGHKADNRRRPLI